MGRQVGKLTALAVSRMAKPGLHADGGGLYLQVTATGARTWIFRYKVVGRARDMGLGAAHTVSLSEARAKALECRKQRLAGQDPIEIRKAEAERARFAAARTVSFKGAAEAYIGSHKAGWRNAKHGDQWASTLETYVYPVFGEVPVQDVDVAYVMSALEPIWSTKTETASRVRGRIESVLSWAAAQGYREGENPARWRGHLDHLLPARAKVQKVVHHAALPYPQMPRLFAEVGRREGVSAEALQFLILTAARTSEVLQAE